VAIAEKKKKNFIFPNKSNRNDVKQIQQQLNIVAYVDFSDFLKVFSF